MASRDEAVATAERLLRELRRPILLGGRSVVVGGSIGIALAIEADATVEDVMIQADAAMYAAKAAGKDRYGFFEEQMPTRTWTSSKRPAEVGLAPPGKTQGGGLGRTDHLPHSACRHDAAVADRARTVPAHQGGDGYLMRINRTLLYTGVFLAAIGAAVIVADFAAVATPALIDVLRLWPLALIRSGLASRFDGPNSAWRAACSPLPSRAHPRRRDGRRTAGRHRARVLGQFKAAYSGTNECARLQRDIDFGNVHIESIGGCR